MWTLENRVYEIGTSGPNLPFTYSVGVEGRLGSADSNDAESTALANHQ